MAMCYHAAGVTVKYVTGTVEYICEREGAIEEVVYRNASNNF